MNCAIRYGVAALSVGAALVVAISLEHQFFTQAPFLLFYAAVAVSSWYGGTGPGLVAIVLSALAANMFVLSPPWFFFPDDPAATARLTVFVLTGALIATLNGALRRSQHRCELEADAARRNEARAKRLAEANLLGVFFSDLDGNIRWANSEFLRLVGCTPGQLEARQVNWREVTAPEHRPRDARAIAELKQCRVCTPFEKDHLLRDGQRIPALVGCAMLDDSVQDVVGFVLDLTERKRAEAEVRAHQQRLQAMGAELMMAEERERRRIATVLHDAVVQMLALSKLKLDALRRAGPGGNANGSDARLAEVYDLIEQSITHTRTLTAELSPPVLYELGLPAAIQWLGDRLRADHGIAFELVDDRRPRHLSEQARVVLFQAVRELLINVVKHARASKCRVELGRTDAHVKIIVDDDGEGFRRVGTTDYSSGGFGLFNIRQRLAYLGGSLDVAPRPGGGTRVTLVAPLAEIAEGAQPGPHDDDEDHNQEPAPLPLGAERTSHRSIT